jgi:DNA polymerase-3 subunit delta'
VSIPAALPWHARQWQALAGALDQGRVHHAMMVVGAPGLGKALFAARAAAALLCESSEPAAERPCGRCRSCLLVAPADALNRHAANTLLKTLEEPSGAALFLLVSARPATLPATVRSRCLTMRIHAPARRQALDWLRAQCPGADAERLLEWCGGAPLAAVDAAQSGALERFDAMGDSIEQVLDGGLSAVDAAAGWRALGLATVAEWQLRMTVSAMRIKVMRDPGRAGVALQAISSRLDLRQLERVCDELLELRSAVDRQLHPGDQLALESLAVSWREAARRSG